jgi:hypothetical protein
MNWRVRLGIVLMVVFSLFQSFRALEYYNPSFVWKRVQRGEGAPADFLTHYKKDISCLVPQLLSPSQVVGFVTSVPNKKQELAAIFHMTQFAIVPFLLEDSLNHNLVIAYFPNKVKPKPSIPAGFLVARQCTDEIFLLQRNAQ